MKKLDNFFFTLMDLGIKKSRNVQIYDKNSLDADGNVIPFDVQLAIVTHYILLQHGKFASTYAEKAQELIESWLGNPDIVNRLQKGAVCESVQTQNYLFQELFAAPFPAPKNPKFTFIDLFAGIGGFRIALQNLGGECVFSSEWDKQAQKTYLENFGDIPFGYITKESTKKIYTR